MSNSSTTTELSSKPFYKTHWCGVAIFGLALIVVVIIIGFYVVNNLNNSRDEKIQTAIANAMNNEDNAHNILPDILILNLSQASERKLTDSVKANLTSYLLHKYLDKRTANNKALPIQPYLTFLDNIDNKPNIVLTSEQLLQLKKHIEYLTGEVDKAVGYSKDDISVQISKVNTWMSVWIATFGIFGIFIPIVVNLKSFESLKDIEFKAEKAEEKANKAEEKIITHKADFEAISGLVTDVKDAQISIAALDKSIPLLESQTAVAIKNANEAVNQSNTNNKLLVAFTTISNLKSLENIILLNRENPWLIINAKLAVIVSAIKQIDENFLDDFYNDLIKELRGRLYILSSSTIIKKRKVSESFAEVVEYIDKLKFPLNIETNQALIKKLDELLIKITE